MPKQPQKAIQAENSRRAKIWTNLQPIAEKILEEFRAKARERGVAHDNWINWSNEGFIFVRVNIKAKQHGPYYDLPRLYKDGRLVLDPSEDYRPYDYPDFLDNAVRTFRPKINRELQYLLDKYCAEHH